MLCFLKFLFFFPISAGNSDISFDKVIKWWGSHLLWSQGHTFPSLKSIQPVLYFIFLSRVSASPCSPVCSLVIWCGDARYGRSNAAICGLSASLKTKWEVRWDDLQHAYQRGRDRRRGSRGDVHGLADLGGGESGIKSNRTEQNKMMGTLTF